MMPDDWREGLLIQPRHKDARKMGLGQILKVLPDRTGGLNDKDGVLLVQLLDSGIEILTESSDWVTIQ